MEIVINKDVNSKIESVTIASGNESVSKPLVAEATICLTASAKQLGQSFTQVGHELFHALQFENSILFGYHICSMIDNQIKYRL